MQENSDADRTWATFRMWGGGLEPHEVSTRLNIDPSRAHRRGDRRGKNKVWANNHWELTSQDQVSSSDLEVHINWLLDQLEPGQTELLMLLAEPDVQADIFCYWESATGQGGPGFSPSVMRRLVEFNLKLNLDIYFSDAARELWESLYQRLES
jgi:hypothetical protein